jgi:hypothetical protein
VDGFAADKFIGEKVKVEDEAGDDGEGSNAK